MAAQQATPSESDDDDFHSLSAQGHDDKYWHDHRHVHDDNNDAAEVDDPADDEGTMTPPVHPLPSFQAPFEESILESTQGPDKLDATDAEMRRRRLLEAERYEDVVATRWRQRPGAEYHPFLKVMAQIVFGMHLLKDEQAKSNQEVVRILQNHVNEVDGFLERTAEDFDLAIRDIEERIRYLKLPMQHMNLFEEMLDEKKFRTGLLNGNEKIERIIAKTTVARRAAMVDIHHGIKSTKELRRYLDRVEGGWPTGNRDIAAVLTAMRGNEEGWAKYLRDLRTKGYNLKNCLVVLETIVAEISKHAAAASRRNTSQSKTVSPTTKKGSSCSSPLLSKFAKDSPPAHRESGPWLDKPLPREPNAVPGAHQVLVVKPHPVPLETRYEQPRQLAPASTPRTGQNEVSQRPHTASGVESDSRIRIEYFSNSGGLRSHPPDRARDHAGASERSAGHGRSHSTSIKQDKPLGDGNKRTSYRRSRSQGAMLPLTEKPKEPKHIPRKPIPKRDRKDEGPPPVLENRKHAAPYALTRRISQRLKALEVPKFASTTSTTFSTRKEIATPRPIDSAHSSQGSRRSNDAVKTPDSPDGARTMQTAAQPVKKGLVGKQSQDIIRRATDASQGEPTASPSTAPFTPSRAARESVDANPGSDTKAYIPLNLNSSPASHQKDGKGGHRTLSLKTFFQYRGKASENRDFAVS